MAFTEKDGREFLDCGSIIQVNTNQYLIGWGQRCWHKNSQQSGKPQFYFPDFFLTHSTPWFEHEKTALLTAEELVKLSPENQEIKTSIWKNNHSLYFEETFKNLQMLFSKNLLKKAVPYVFEESGNLITRERLASALKKLLAYSLKLPLHVYGFWDEKEGILGATPEILFKYTNHDGMKIKTCALAGTKSNSIDPQLFMNDTKELKEHHLVVKGICESLSSFGTVKTGQLSILKLPRLSHLITPIEVEATEPLQFLSIVKALHPTPALGAFPKNEGMQWLESYQQKIERGRFGAPLGCLFEQGRTALCLVGIRNVQWNQMGAKIFAGCGVIQESRLDHEWQELCLKISSIKEMLSL